MSPEPAIHANIRDELLALFSCLEMASEVCVRCWVPYALVRGHAFDRRSAILCYCRIICWSGRKNGGGKHQRFHRDTQSSTDSRRR